MVEEDWKINEFEGKKKREGKTFNGDETMTRNQRGFLKPYTTYPLPEYV